MNDDHCTTNVTRRECDARHRSVTKWLSTQIVLLVTVLSCTGAAYVSARSASQDVAVQKAVQQEVNKSVLDSLKRIEMELRALRTGQE